MTKEYLNKDPLVVLKEVWGYDDFRENQLEAIQTIINQKNDILYLARTSAGKSIVYQLPSLVLDGVALIVSPLLSLMEDQVIATQNKGIRAYTINSTIGIKEKRKIFEALEKNEVDLLFMAPESIVNLEFLDFLKDKCKISFVAADESHCASSYGNDFRPKYRSFAKVLRTILDVPFIALTATADERTVEDIKVAFNFSEESDKPLVTFTQDLDRPSITYNVMEKSGNGLKQIKEIIDSYPKNTSGIIYCTTRKQVEELQFQLYKLGYKSVAYHAGMKKKQKQESFEKWMTKKAPIAVCTIAFGLGIDKADVRFVINQCIPSSIEDLIQLWGRASRDGEPSQAFVLYDKKDVTLLQWMMKQSTVNQNYLKIQLDKLHQVHTLVQSKDCIRKQMLNYFGQDYEHENCNSCSNCMTSVPI